jgi:PAS domain S-box-containing protein
VGSWELDLRRQELTWSDEAHRIHGTTRATFKPSFHHALNFFAPDSVPVVKTAIRNALKTGEGFDQELEIVTAAGERRWVRTNVRVERVHGETIRLYGAFQDIEALKRSELRIQEQSDWLRLAMDAAQILAWRWHPTDDRLVLEYRSPSFDSGIPIGATLAEDMRDVHRDDRARLRAALTQTVENGQPTELEFRTLDSVGRERWLATRVIRAVADGKPIAIGATYEVTARRDAEDALRASEAVLRSVSENSPDHIVVADANLNVTFVNRSPRGRSPAAVIGQPFFVGAAGEGLDMEARLRSVLANGRPVRFESRGQRTDGTEALFENRVGPVEQQGKVTGVIVYATDITDRRALESEILEISNREQRRIGSDLHDGLGQELTGIALMLRGLTSSLGRGQPLAVADLEEVVALVNGAIDTTRTLARGLSPVALEGGGLVYALRALAARAREMYGLDVRFRSRVTPRVTLDAAATGHLYRIAQESLTNTARHAGASQVTVQLTVRGRRVTLTVADDGRGIAAGAGSGMGLKIMRYRAHMLGGELSIETSANGGTRIACTVLQPDPEAAGRGGPGGRA